VIADVIVVIDEGLYLPFKIARQVVIVEQDAVGPRRRGRGDDNEGFRVCIGIKFLKMRLRCANSISILLRPSLC
jgi:hypothetical protein